MKLWSVLAVEPKPKDRRRCRRTYVFVVRARSKVHAAKVLAAKGFLTEARVKRTTEFKESVVSQKSYVMTRFSDYWDDE